MAQLLFGSVTCGPWTPRGFSESRPSEQTQVGGILFVAPQLSLRLSRTSDPAIPHRCLSVEGLRRTIECLVGSDGINRVVALRTIMPHRVIKHDVSAWAEIFGDAVAVEAMVDRVVHHSHILTLKGDSYRLKNKHKEMGTTNETH